MPLPTSGPALSYLASGAVTLTVPWVSTASQVSPGYAAVGGEVAQPAVPATTTAGTATFTFTSQQAWREIVDAAERLARAGSATVT